MRDVACDVCGSQESDLYAERPPRFDVLHQRFVRCSACGFIYANPRATATEAQRFYESMSERGSGSLSAPTDTRAWRLAVKSRRRLLHRAAKRLPASHPIRFLDIGFGDGSTLAAAAELGWEAHGLEYAGWLVDAARDRLGIETVRVGDITDAATDENAFDVVHAWHVIEHVPDIDAWLGSIVRSLRPGGVLVIGTENSECLFATIWCGIFGLLHRVPWPPTSADHTYWFSRSSLVQVVSRHGLEPTDVRVYETGPIDILRAESLTRLRNPRWAATLMLYLLSSLASLVRPRFGGKLSLIAEKPL